MQKSSCSCPFISSTMSGLTGHYADPYNNDYSNAYGNSSYYEHTLSNHPQHQPTSSISGPFANSVPKAITCASHETLIRSGNIAYMSMHTQFLQAKCELEAERCVIIFRRIYAYFMLSEKPLHVSRKLSTHSQPPVLLCPRRLNPLQEAATPRRSPSPMHQKLSRRMIIQMSRIGMT